ncbi:MAG: MFS transporter, partial [Myxococcaceae bacterium]
MASRRSPLVQIFSAVGASMPWASRGGPAATPPFAAGPDAEAPQATPARARRIRRSLVISSIEGMIAEVVTACVGGAMITAWALHLHCSPALIGVLSSLSFMSQFIQFPAAWLTSTFGHRRVCIAVVATSRFWLVALALMPLLPFSLHGKQIALVVVSAVYALLSVAGNNAWVAWMGDLVPASLRGRYFGRRTALCMLGGTIASVAAGYLLDRARTANIEALGLATLAVIAVLCGAICLYLMLQQHDPGAETATRFELRSALKQFRDRSARG